MSKYFLSPASRAREGYGSVRERDLNDGGKLPEREASSNSTIGRRTNGKAGIQQQQQQPPQPQQIKGRQQSQPQRPASKSMDYPTGTTFDLETLAFFI